MKGNLFEGNCNLKSMKNSFEDCAGKRKIQPRIFDFEELRRWRQYVVGHISPNEDNKDEYFRGKTELVWFTEL